GWAPHGGGAFSGKDPSKVDRSATYAARHIAKNVVAAKLASECLVQLAYAIGVAQPVSVFVNTYGTGVRPDAEISKMIMKEVDLSPNGIIKRLQLRRPIYSATSSYGHFGRTEKDFTWENLDLVPTFKKHA
ncbi:MAG TPA: methionine adenosyltransferase domain-containing protein, partial [Ignavibacteriales bacterium]|nr:methionine adenosyltransferase domain-containing protein [Ignavibacteriales bacterium]